MPPEVDTDPPAPAVTVKLYWVTVVVVVGEAVDGGLYEFWDTLDWYVSVATSLSFEQVIVIIDKNMTNMQTK